MKLIIGLLSLATLLAFTGCDWDEHHHHHNYGGAYDGYYSGYGHEAYPGRPYSHDWQWDHDHWEHR
jgi:hypothetical protein